MNNEQIKSARQELGGFFKKRRIQMGRTLQEVADYVGITTNTLNGVETGRFAHDIDLHLRLCAALEIKPLFSPLENPTAKELLSMIMNKRGWHNNVVTPNRAAFDKTIHSRGKMSYERCCWYLQKLGYKIIQNEIWEKHESTITDQEVKS